MLPINVLLMLITALRTSMPSMQAMVVPRTGLSPSRSSFDPNFLKDSLLLPTPVREPPSHEIVI